MRRLVLIATLAALACAATASAAVSPVVSAKLGACQSGATPDARYALYRTSMEAIAGTERMSVRFDLSMRATDTAPYTTATAPGLGEWITSAPGVDIFRYRKQVTNLTPGTYRTVVSFRWTNAKGKVIASAKRTTAACVQPDTRPALAIGTLDFAKVSDPALLRYIVPVRNDGRADAGPFDVSLSIDGIVQDPVTVTGLAAGTTQTVTFVALRCKGGADVRIQLDPGARIDEADRSDNTKMAGCPLSR